MTIQVGINEGRLPLTTQSLADVFIPVLMIAHPKSGLLAAGRGLDDAAAVRTVDAGDAPDQSYCGCGCRN